MHRFVAACLALSGFCMAQTPREAIVTVEASRGGAGNGLRNATIHIPLEQTYTNTSILNEVSYLFLTGAEGVPLNSITCTPYKSSDGTGNAGNPFNSTSPSLLSTNTVIVGSIVCKSSGNGNSTTTSLTSGSSSSSTSSSSSSSNTSSTSVTTSISSTTSVPPPVATQTLTSMVSTGQATVISTATAAPASTSSANTPPSSTTSSPPGLSTGSSGAARTSAFVYSGLAIVGLAFAFTL